MPAQEETPQLPISTVDTETGAGSREPEVPETETEAEKKIEETEDEGREPDGQNACGAEC